MMEQQINWNGGGISGDKRRIGANKFVSIAFTVTRHYSFWFHISLRGWQDFLNVRCVSARCACVCLSWSILTHIPTLSLLPTQEKVLRHRQTASNRFATVESSTLVVVTFSGGGGG